MTDLVRQSVYSRLAGYQDLNDAIRVSADPTFRLIGSKKNWDRGGELTSRRQSFEAELLAREENLLGLMAVNRELVAQAEGNSVTLRADAAFAKPEIYEALEERGVDYAIRIPANKNLDLEIEDILFRPPGRPSTKPLVRYKSFHYQGRVGRSRDGSSPRSSIIQVSCFLASVSSSQAWPCQAVLWCASTTSGVPLSSGSRKANRQPVGPGCRAIVFEPTRCDSNSPFWPATSETSGGGWGCRSGSRAGR